MRFAPWVILGLSLVACVSQAPTRPDIQIPSSWQQGLGAGAVPDAQWFKAFGDAGLDALVAEALRSSPDVEAAEARIRQADARLRASGAALLPTVTASAAINRTSTIASSQSARETDTGVQFAASYEVDFWGATRAGQRAAREQARASRAETDVLRLTLQASVAETYLDILELRAQQATSRRLVQLLTDGAAALEARNAAGLVSAAELSLYRSPLAAARAKLASLQQQEIEAAAALALLVGRNAPIELPAQPALRDLKIPPPAGAAPAELLVRRPDIAAAEANLSAAEANMVVARAALFPRLTLDAVLAHQNPGFQAALTTLEGPGNSLSLAAALMQTLFDGGKVRAQRAEVQARREELVAEYRKAILAALIDAQRALTVQQVLEHQQLEAEEAERSTQKTEQALAARGDAGLGDRLVVIEARRAALTAQDENDHAYALRLKAAVGLFKALGGGWHNEAAQ